MGPSAIRYAGLEDRLQELGIECEDWGNVERPWRRRPSGSPQARFLEQIRETCERIARAVARAVEEERTPIVLGGDHSIALGTLGGLASVTGRAASCGSMRTAT